MKKLFENKDKDLFEFIIYFLFIIRKSFIRQNTDFMVQENQLKRLKRNFWCPCCSCPCK